MTRWEPDVDAIEERIALWRETGMSPEMIGFRVGWSWATERVAKHSTDQMVEMALLHEQEKKRMSQMFNAHLGMIRAGQTSVAKRLAISAMVTFVLGVFAGGVLI